MVYVDISDKGRTPPTPPDTIEVILRSDEGDAIVSRVKLIHKDSKEYKDALTYWMYVRGFAELQQTAKLKLKQV